MNRTVSKAVRFLGLALSALPLLPWPMFLAAGVMAPPGDRAGEGLFGAFVLFTMAYPLAFFAALKISKRSHALAIVSVVPFAMFNTLGVVSGALAGMLRG